MSLILIEGFDSLSALSRKYTTFGSPALYTSNPRHGSQNLGAGGQGHGITIPLNASYSVLYIGFGLRANSFYNPASDSQCLCRFVVSASMQCAVGLDAAGHIKIMRGTITLGTSSNSLLTGTWYYIEIKVTISNSISLGDFQVKVNDVVWLNLPATTDTQGQATNLIDQVNLSGNGLTGNMAFDDLHILNTNGSKNNGFLGDSKIITLYPNGNGNTNQFDGSDGNQTDNYLLVDEAQDNGDTDYVESSVVSEKDQYAFDNISDIPELIHGISCRGVIKKTDSGSRTGRLLCRSGGADYEGASFNPGLNYLGYDEIFEDDPDTSLAWSKSGIGSAEFGVKVQA